MQLQAWDYETGLLSAVYIAMLFCVPVVLQCLYIAYFNFAGFLETERLVYTLQCCKSNTMNNNKTSKPALKLNIIILMKSIFNNSALVNL